MKAREWLRKEGGSSHLVLSGVDFAQRIRAVRCRKTAVFIKLDLKDFYLEGELQKLAALVEPGNVGSGVGSSSSDILFFDALVLLLEEQYLECSELCPSISELYRIIIGVGQGLALENRGQLSRRSCRGMGS